MAIYDNRVCRYCGVTFSGGPRAWYCPNCRQIRKSERAKKYRKQPPKRKIGSTDICENCGEKYIVASGLQKYCEKCAPEMLRKTDAKQSLEYYKNNKDVINAKRYEKRKGIERKCVVCGKLFYASDRSICCSEECRNEYMRANSRNIYDKRRRLKKTHPER